MMRVWMLAAGFGWRPVVRHPPQATQSSWTKEREAQRGAEGERERALGACGTRHEGTQGRPRLPRLETCAERKHGRAQYCTVLYLPQQHAHSHPGRHRGAAGEERWRCERGRSDSRSGGAHAVADQRSAPLTG